MDNKLNRALGNIDESLIFEAANADRVERRGLKTAAVGLTAAAAVAAVALLAGEIIPSVTERQNSGVSLLESSSGQTADNSPSLEVVKNYDKAQRFSGLYPENDGVECAETDSLTMQDIENSFYFGSNFPRLLCVEDDIAVFTDGADSALFMYDISDYSDDSRRLLAKVNLLTTVQNNLSDSLDTLLPYEHIGNPDGGETNGITAFAAKKDGSAALFVSVECFGDSPEERAECCYRIISNDSGDIFLKRQGDLYGWEKIEPAYLGGQMQTQSGDSVSIDINGKTDFSEFALKKNDTEFMPFMLTLPDFSGQTVEEINAWAAERKLSLTINPRYEERADMEEFAVISTEPAAGESFFGSEITAVLCGAQAQYSDGMLIMPDFTGKSINDASLWLASHGIKADISLTIHKGTEKGCVISTEPAAGEPIDPNADCIITYADVEESYEPFMYSGTPENVRKQADERGEHVLMIYSLAEADSEEFVPGECCGSQYSYGIGETESWIVMFYPNGEEADFIYPLDLKQIYHHFISDCFDSGYGHKGVDFTTSDNEPIFAAESGTVTRAEHYFEYGYCIEIDHGNGLSTLYGHCSEMNVSAGDFVERGQIIGKTGTSGYITKTTLHFEVRIDGTPADPMDYIYMDADTAESSGAQGLFGTNHYPVSDSTGDKIDALSNAADSQIREIISAAEYPDSEADRQMVFPIDCEFKEEYITTRFGYDEWRKSTHTGIDIGYKDISSEPVYAAQTGKVLAVNIFDPARGDDPANKLHGSYIILAHSGGCSTVYAHCSDICVEAGDEVTAGDIIGYVGNTGWSTGDHLHFEVRENGEPIDPLTKLYLPKG